MPDIVYGLCAAVGGTVMALQFLASAVGFGSDHGGDMVGDHGGGFGDHGGMGGDGHDAGDGFDDHDSSWFFGVLSFRTLIAALTFFGLAGLAGGKSGWDPNTTLVVAVLCGAIALYGVYWLGVGLSRLQADATVQVQGAIGSHGTVYLRVPAGRSGVGKVHISQQSRTMEYEAVTEGRELPVGASVEVVAVAGSEVVVVREAN